jgi:two-component system, OmpR family, alkaline phosphatase synthesis response regulator PhoP
VIPVDPKRILIVDDDLAVADSLARALTRLGGYEVRTENRGDRALAAARGFSPDLVFLDIVMPGMDGNAVAEALQADPQFASTRVAFLTGLVSAEELGSSALDQGGHWIIPKPVEPQELMRIVETILGK